MVVYNKVIKSKCLGDMQISCEDSHVTIKDILYVSELSRSLLSVAQITDDNYGVYFDNSCVELISTKTGHVNVKGERRGNLFYLTKFWCST